MYKLNKKWFVGKEREVVSTSKITIDFGYPNAINNVANSQTALHILYDMGKPYVTKDGESKTIAKKSKKKIKKVVTNDPKETTNEQKEEQVLPEASEE
jgi:uncharacterized membrane protein|tara:strand:+ start:25324 stop:25617 length:294 start_codon:yes stop_codon:yes gene_type:complete